MKDEIKEIINFKEDADYKKLSVDEIVILKNYITNLQQRNIELMVERDRLKELCNAYEEEHNTTFEKWKKDINIIDELKNKIDTELEKNKILAVGIGDTESLYSKKWLRETLEEFKGVINE